ncbi:MAG: hypothetical protein ACODAF_09060 [Actinomycetota bacterium]
MIGTAALLAATACGGDAATTVTGDGAEERRNPSTDTEHPPDVTERPPDVTVRGDGTELALEPYTYCWGQVCVDGAPSEPLPDAGSPAELEVQFPEPDWTFSAEFRRADDDCARTQTAELEPLSSTTHRLVPHGEAASYDVDLFGRGDGDLFVRFRWTTPEDGPPPEPEAWLSVLADRDGAVDSYGVELSVTNLASSPEQAGARITVTAADGEQHTFEPTPTSYAPEECDAIVGQLAWRGPEEDGRRAAELGDPPFSYTVDLELDGTSYVGTATWPDDEHPDRAPAVPLTFEPPLPSL